MSIERFQVGSLMVEVHPDAACAGRAAAEAAAQTLRQLASQRESFGVIFATGASQLETLRALVSLPNLPWNKINGFHLDEYVGIDVNHRASFRRYLRDKLTSQVQMYSFSEIDGNAEPRSFIAAYAEKLRAANPDLCFLGIGENGHLAFNEPDQADFNDPLDLKVVTLDAACRQQQFAEGWFDNLNEVPAQAISVTIPALFRVPRLIVTIPGPRKAQIVKRALTEAISTNCPATILRTHPNATAYLDRDSAAELERI